MDPLPSFVVGAAYALVVGMAVGFVIAKLRAKRRRRRWYSASASVVERSIYFVAVATGQYVLAAGWIALKAAGSWNTWSKKAGVFNRFMLGTGLSLLYGGAGGWLPTSLMRWDWREAVVVALAPVVVTIFVLATELAPLTLRRLLDPEARRRKISRG